MPLSVVLLMLILSTLFDKLCRVACPNLSLANRLGDYTACTDNGTATDSEVTRNDGATADKGVLADGDMTLDKVNIAQVGVACVKTMGQYADTCGDVGIVLNGDITRMYGVKLHISRNEVLMTDKIYSRKTDKALTPRSGHRNPRKRKEE